MRLRSTQFVFLLLLACSVQIREADALRLIAEATLTAPQLREVSCAVAHQHCKLVLPANNPTAPLGVSPGQGSLARTAWAMPQPASSSASVSTHTGLFRA